MTWRYFVLVQSVFVFAGQTLAVGSIYPGSDAAGDESGAAVLGVDMPGKRSITMSLGGGCCTPASPIQLWPIACKRLVSRTLGGYRCDILVFQSLAFKRGNRIVTAVELSVCKPFCV
jgi:hypothetical protein